VTITFDNPPTTFDVVGVGTGNPANVAYTSGGDITYNGWTIQISGTPDAGDVFTVRANTNAVGDNRNALALGQLQKQSTLENGTATYQDAYGAFVADVGTKTRQADISRQAQEVLLQKSNDARESLSGVNLDEEAADLMRYQQLYQATTRIVTIADSMFQSLLNAVGR
jgi:flagellar hook-associated protein 1 FlgK